jgi:hypothetical protein
MSTSSKNNGDLWAALCFLPPGLIDRLCIEVTTAGSAGAVIRLGAYAFSPTGSLPVGGLLVDGGTVDATTTGAKEITVSLNHPGGPIYLAAATQGAPTTLPVVRAQGGGRLFMVQTALRTQLGNRLGFVATGVTGTLPDPFPAGATDNDSVYPLVWVRYA